MIDKKFILLNDHIEIEFIKLYLNNKVLVIVIFAITMA